MLLKPDPVITATTILCVILKENRVNTDGSEWNVLCVFTLLLVLGLITSLFFTYGTIRIAFSLVEHVQ